MQEKFHVWEIGLFEDLLFVSSERGVHSARQLLRAQPRGGRRKKAALMGRFLLGVGSFAGSSTSPSSEQQLACLLIGPQEDEPSQADGCHPRDDTCKQARQSLRPPDATKGSQNVSTSSGGTSLCQHNSCLRYIERCGNCSCKSTFKNSQRGNCTREKGISLNTVLL